MRCSGDYGAVRTRFGATRRGCDAVRAITGCGAVEITTRCGCDADAIRRHTALRAYITASVSTLYWARAAQRPSKHCVAAHRASASLRPRRATSVPVRYRITPYTHTTMSIHALCSTRTDRIRIHTAPHRTRISSVLRPHRAASVPTLGHTAPYPYCAAPASAVYRTRSTPLSYLYDAAARHIRAASHPCP